MPSRLEALYDSPEGAVARILGLQPVSQPAFQMGFRLGYPAQCPHEPSTEADQTLPGQGMPLMRAPEREGGYSP